MFDLSKGIMVVTEYASYIAVPVGLGQFIFSNIDFTSVWNSSNKLDRYVSDEQLRKHFNSTSIKKITRVNIKFEEKLLQLSDIKTGESFYLVDNGINNGPFRMVESNFVVKNVAGYMYIKDDFIYNTHENLSVRKV